MKHLIISLLLLFLNDVSAQQSSKSKSKDRFREKDASNFPVRVTNANEINQVGADYAPTYFKEGIVFLSNRDKTAKSGEGAAELYYAFFTYNSEPEFPQKMDFAFEKKSNPNAGPVCFARDNKTVFLTLPNTSNGGGKADKNGKAVLKICESQYGKPNWTKPVELPFNSGDYSCMHPSLSADGTTLFFSSDMPGGHGGYDIYAVERNGTGWGAPANLGPTVNTDKQEIFPNINISGALFFSSNGRSNSLGGFDNYFVKQPLNNPEEVVNLGEDFNSNADDMSFIIDDEGKTGFFSSSRLRGAGNMDIYRFEASNGLEGIGKSGTNIAQIFVTDAKTGRPLQKAEIRILQASDDGFVSDGKDFYNVDMKPVPEKPNALSLQLSLKNAEDLGSPDYYSNAEGKAQVELKRYQNYLILVSLPGYSVKEKLVGAEMKDNTLLQFKLSEAPPCFRAGGIVATEGFSSRILRASVHFIHRETGLTEQVLSNQNGEYTVCLPIEGEYIAYVSHPSFRKENYRLIASKSEEIFTETRLEPLVPASGTEKDTPLANSIEVGTTIILDRIFKTYNSATLQKSEEIYLDAVFDLLQQYPQMEIDLIAHTDTRGTAQLNQELTQARAATARSYLLNRGIAASRVVDFGKGESEPRNRCREGVECSDEEHQQNNRVLVWVRKVK
jgi:outer membrane protein OmpA-like peptidoglycan-associated protein